MKSFWIKNRWIFLLTILQVVLVLIAFKGFFAHPYEYFIVEHYDGLKNYFTFQAFIEQDAAISDHWLKLMMHNYPYGDFIFFTDNTPGLAIPIRWFSENIYDLKEHSLMLFHAILFFFQFITVFFTYKLLGRFIHNKWMLVILSVAFAWIHPQFLRLIFGHFNLSFAWVFLGIFYYLLKLYELPADAKLRQRNWILVKMGLIVCFASFMHLYYLGISWVFGGLFALIWAIRRWQLEQKTIREAAAPLFQVGLALGLGGLIAYGYIALVDGYGHLRTSGSAGYGYTAWKLHFEGIYTPHFFSGVKFPFHWTNIKKPIPYETQVYLGNFALFGLLGLAALRLFKRQWWIPFKDIFTGRKGQFLRILFWVGLICFSIALGEDIYLHDNEYVIHNYLNPFFYLRKLTDRVTQFRCLARFFWISWWAVNLMMIVIVYHYWRFGSHGAINVFILGLFVLLMLDTKDVVRMQNRKEHQNVFATAVTGHQKVVDSLDVSKYQAFMPIPYFNTGCDVLEFNIDGGHVYNRQCQALSLYTNLPMMATQSARLPKKHMEDFFSIFLADRPNQDLLDRMNAKPVLVVLDKAQQAALHSDQPLDFRPPAHEPSRAVVMDVGPKIIDRYQMKKLAETERYSYYEWDIEQLKK